MTRLLLHELVLHHAASNAAAIDFGDRTTSYSDLARNMLQAAAALKSAGLTPGDRVLWVGKNHPACIEMLLAASAAGCVFVPVNWRLAPAEMATIIADTHPAIAFADPAFAPVVREAIGPSVPLIIVDGEADGYAVWRSSGRAHASWKPAADPDAVVVQLYTSGTTGRPKGAMLSHRALVEPKLSWVDQEWYHWRPDDACLLAMPLFHIGGIAWLVQALIPGARTVLLVEFEELAVFRAIEERKATKTFLVPAALRALARHPAAATTDFSPLRMVLYGASPMPLPLLNECFTVFGCDFAQVYGMTESSGVIAVLDPDIHRARDEARLVATGKPLPEIEIEIRDPQGRTLPIGEVGEVVTRSVANMAGYWQMDEATRDTIDADGWLKTGDAGYFDGDGYLFVCDRVKDMIISGGENIYPAEIESVLSGHPAFAEVAVVGLPDERWGEVPMAFVVARGSVRPTADEMVDWARSKLAGYKIPRRLAYLDAMPRNATGKIVRKDLKDHALAAARQLSET